MNILPLAPAQLAGRARWVILVCVALACVACGDEPSTRSAPTPTHLAETADTLTIGDVLRTDNRFSTLVAALDSTRLDSILTEPGPFTLLAPPNSAFEGLPDGTLDILITERRERLRRILQHHIINQRIPSTNLGQMTVVTTFGGDSLRIQADSVLTVGNARVVTNDVSATNGLIHVVDQVLRPPPSDSE